MDKNGYAHPVLAVPRAVGDNIITGISPLPKVYTVDIDESKETYLVQCCDGVFDVASSHQVGARVSDNITAGNSAEDIVNDLVTQAYKAGSRDNLSALLTQVGGDAKASAPIPSEQQTVVSNDNPVTWQSISAKYEYVSSEVSQLASMEIQSRKNGGRDPVDLQILKSLLISMQDKVSDLPTSSTNEYPLTREQSDWVSDFHSNLVFTLREVEGWIYDQKNIEP